MAFNQVKMLNDLRKAQKDLAKEIIEVEAGDGAVVVQITGELKVKSVKIDPAYVDLDDISELEHWIEIAAPLLLARDANPRAGSLGPGVLRLYSSGSDSEIVSRSAAACACASSRAAGVSLPAAKSRYSGAPSSPLSAAIEDQIND